MALSLAQDAKRALYDGLEAALSPGVDVFVGGFIDAREERVIVGPQDRPLTFDQEWHTIGAGSKRAEELEIPVRVEVFRGDRDPFVAEDRAWEIAETVATFLAARPFEVAIFEAHPDRGEQVTEVFQEGFQASVTFVVHCSGRIGGI